MQEMQKNWAICLAASAVILTGCGGGGIEAGARLAAQTVSAPALAAYVGIWRTDCNEQTRQSIAINLKGDGSGALELSPTTSYYAQADCSGPVQATETLSTLITATPDGAQDHTLLLAAGKAPETVRIDKIISTLPQFTFRIDGPAADYVVKSTQHQWHIDLGAAGTVHVYDDGLQAAQTLHAGLVLHSNELFTVIQNNGAYVVNTHYIRQIN